MPAANASTALRDVSDTALWVAVYRAEESARRDALFHDPFAQRLAGERGKALLDHMPNGRRYAWPMVLRTVLFDRLIGERVAAGAEQVVNLAAGLDTRPYRMTLPSELRGIVGALPHMLAYKRGVRGGERPVCRLERMACDLADGAARRALLAELAGNGSRTLVLAEGLLIYLERDQVAALATDLAQIAGARWWLLDLASPALLRWMAKTWGKEVASAGAPFRFAPAEGPAFFEPLGWQPIAIESPFHAAARAHRLPLLLRFFALFPEPKKYNPKRVWSGTCLFERR